MTKKETKARNAANFKLKLLIKKDPKINYLKIISQSRKKERSTTNIKEQGGKLIIEIGAKDATSLRASANSILRDLQVIEATTIN